MRIILSNAHCKQSVGATKFYKNEYDYSVQVNKFIAELLLCSGINAIIIDGGTGDSFETLKHKVDMINDIKPLAAIENHLNASSNTKASYGSECLCFPGSNKGWNLATDILNRFSYLPFNKRGVTERLDLYFLKKTTCPAVITEPFFLSHEYENHILDMSRGVEVIGKLIAEGILTWLKGPQKYDWR